MEGWQKGAGAVLKMSGAGKENYFKNFPERKEWFQSNFPEHFGRSVAAATTSLKKVTKAKQQKQRLAIIRQVAEKQNRLKVSSDAVRAMGTRRRESGEGLGGGLETNRDIIAHATAGNYIKSGGLGSLFEEQSLSVDKKEDGYYVGSQGPFKSRADAEAVLKASQLKLPPDRSTNFRYTDGASVDQTTPPPEEETDLSTSIADWLEKLEKQQLKGADWPKPGAQGENKRWGKVLGQVDTEGNEIGWMDQGRQYDILRTPPDDTRIDTRDPSRRPVEKIAQQAGYYYPIKEENIEECMPMPGDNKWDYLDTWEKNPIKKGSTSSEADEEPGEYDYEGDMAKSQLRSIMHNSKMLHDLLEDNTNLPEWVQSKITLAEDYILTAANYMRGEMDRMDEEVEQIDEAGKGYSPGWMLKHPDGKKLALELRRKKELERKRQKSYGDPSAGISVKKEEVEQVDEGRFRRSMRGYAAPSFFGNSRPVRYQSSGERSREMNVGLDDKQEKENARRAAEADKAMKAGITATEQPVMHNDLVAQHMDLHQNTQVTEGMSAAVKLQRAFERAQAESAASRERGKEILAQAHAKYVNDHVALHAPVPRDDENMTGEQLDEMDNYDMINRDALPVPPHRNIRGVQDRINAGKRKDNKNNAKQQKIIKKVSKALQKKRMALPTDNPSANELVPKSMLPDVPGYPEGYQMEEQVVEQPVEIPVVEENTNLFVSAGSKFLTRTSTRLVYGEKDE